MLHDFDKTGIVRGLGDEQMEAPVGLDTAVVVAGQPLIVIQRLAHLLQLVFAATLGRQGHRLGFQAQAQLQDCPHTRRSVDIEPQPRLAGLRQHKGADAVAGLHQPRSLQLGNRLAHHGPADAMLANDGTFRWQFFPGFQLPQQDALAQLRHQIMGQVMGTLAQRRFGVLHRQGSSKTGLIDPTTGRLESAHYRTPNLYDNTPYLAINFENQRPESLDPYRTAPPAHNQKPQYNPINTA
ncbi:hypothetical protein D3C76_991580 [compost metagenome]